LRLHPEQVSYAHLSSKSFPLPRLTLTATMVSKEIRTMSTTHSKRFPFPLNQATLVIIAGALILSAAMGIRQTFGLFIGPFSFDPACVKTHADRLN
jgi:hypothetical protein